MITVTDKALKRIEHMVEQRGSGLGIRIAVKTTGCSGLAYVLEYLDTVEDVDIVTQIADNLSIAIDPKSIVYLDGLEVDYVREGLNEGFQFNNPNVRSECGCGESFNV